MLFVKRNRETQFRSGHLVNFRKDAKQPCLKSFIVQLGIFFGNPGSHAVKLQAAFLADASLRRSVRRPYEPIARPLVKIARDNANFQAGILDSALIVGIVFDPVRTEIFLSQRLTSFCRVDEICKTYRVIFRDERTFTLRVSDTVD